MIRIKFEKGQGLGNQLWLFASAKSISEKLNYEMRIENFHNFKGIDFLDLEYKNFSEKEKNKGKIKISEFYERLFYDSNLKYIASGFDENVLNIKENTILRGLFQSEKYFFGDIKKINRYISLKKNKLNYTKQKDTCILNIRGGEYKRHRQFILPKSYWLNGINNFKKRFSINNFKIVTDDYRYARALFPDLEIIHGSIEECYTTIYSCSNIIVSNSTFSYFPCKTGLKKNVIAPMYWARPKNKDSKWISPANIYEEWLWQDSQGKLKNYKQCLPIAEKTEFYYKNKFIYLIPQKDIPKTGILLFIPKNIKKMLRKILSYLFPKLIG